MRATSGFVRFSKIFGFCMLSNTINKICLLKSCDSIASRYVCTYVNQVVNKFCFIFRVLEDYILSNTSRG